jgi:hypothetical protein
MCGAYRTRGGEEKFLVGKPEGKKPLTRPRHILEDNIKIDLKVIECNCVDWIQLAMMGE